jgi:hypothetical protein
VGEGQAAEFFPSSQPESQKTRRVVTKVVLRPLDPMHREQGWGTKERGQSMRGTGKEWVTCPTFLLQTETEEKPRAGPRVPLIKVRHMESEP